MEKCEEVAIGYGTYFSYTIYEFYLMLCGEPIINGHHVFQKNLRNGENRKELEEEFGVDPKEAKDVLAPAHAVSNRLFKGISPPATLQKLADIIEGDHIAWSVKQDFAKLALCVLREKLQVVGKKEKFFKIDQLVKKIEIGINNRNNITIKDTMAILGLTENNISYYLEKNFFPTDWRYFDPKLWDLYECK